MLSFDYSMELDFAGGLASEHAFSLHCLPQQTANQTIHDMTLTIDPATEVHYGTDGFGNRYCYGTIHAQHSRFRVEVKGSAERFPDRHDAAPAAMQMLYRQLTRITEPGSTLQKMAKKIKDRMQAELILGAKQEKGVFRNTPGSADRDIWPLALCIRDYVYETMTYVPGATNPATSAEEAAQKRKGVCQDYAHIMLALCRMCHISARYCAGLLLGEGASHAWVEVCDHGQWRELDPTNPAATSKDRLLFSHGRDASDCEINRGVYLGPSAQVQKISARLGAAGPAQSD